MKKEKAIYQLDIETEKFICKWASATIAEKEKGFNSRRISQVCKGKAYSSNGYKWCYADKSERKKYTSKKKTNKIKQQVIFEINYKDNFSVKKIWHSFQEISKKIKIDEGFIRINCYRNNLPVSKSSSFTYFQDNLFIKEEHYKEAKQIYDQSEKFVCQIPNCNKFYFSKRALATHLQSAHQLDSQEYTIKYLYNNIQPLCPDCGKETRYVSFEFKEYCKKHSSEAMKKGGGIGGKAKAWNKGKTKKNDARLMQQSLLVSGPRNHFYGKSHTEETKNIIAQQKFISKKEYEKRINERKEDFKVLTPYEEYTSRQHQKLNIQCVICNQKTKRTLQSLERGCLCKRCYPFTVSRAETEVGDYIKKELGYNIDLGRRDLIPPKEIDIYIPKEKFAIEYNGLYWHGNLQEGFDKRAHLHKTKACIENGISLIHIFSDEWEAKKDLLKSMISVRLGSKNVKRIFARKCEIKEIFSNEAKEFFSESHISGHVQGISYWALIEPEDNFIVCALSTRTPFHKKYKDYLEIARFASKPFYSVAGGFSRLLKKVEEKAILDGFGGILSYCDRRYGEGNVYLKSGFELIGNTSIDYWYTNGKTRHNRFKFRAQKDKPEKQVAKENGVYKVFGCGNNVYVKNLTPPR